MKKSIRACLRLVGFLGTAGLISPFNSFTAQPAEPTAAPVTETVSYSPAIRDILKMLDAKVDVDVVKAYIKNSARADNPSAAEIIALKKRGVPDELITALIERGAEVRAQMAQASQTTPPPQMLATAAAPATVPAYDYTSTAPYYSYPDYADYGYSPYAGYPYNYWYNYSYPWVYYSPFYFGFHGHLGFHGGYPFRGGHSFAFRGGHGFPGHSPWTPARGGLGGHGVARSFAHVGGFSGGHASGFGGGHVGGFGGGHVGGFGGGRGGFGGHGGGRR